MNIVQFLVFYSMIMLTGYGEMPLLISEHQSFSVIQHVHSADVFKSEYLSSYLQPVPVSFHFTGCQIDTAVILKHLLQYCIIIAKNRLFPFKFLYVSAGFLF